VNIDLKYGTSNTRISISVYLPNTLVFTIQDVVSQEILNYFD